MSEDAAEYVGDGSAERPLDVEVHVRPVSDGPCEAPPTVTILVQDVPGGAWILRCCPPPTMSLPACTARGASLSEALTALAELVEEWEEQQDEDDDYDDGAEFDEDE